MPPTSPSSQTWIFLKKHYLYQNSFSEHLGLGTIIFSFSLVITPSSIFVLFPLLKKFAGFLHFLASSYSYDLHSSQEPYIASSLTFAGTFVRGCNKLLDY